MEYESAKVDVPKEHYDRLFIPVACASRDAPPDRVKILREAYLKALKDPELVAEAQKGQ